MTPHLILIDNYDSFTFNLYQYLEELGARVTVVRNDRITIDQIRKRRPAGVVLSPGPGTPDESGVCLDVLRELPGEMPILGVCLGHQAMGQVFGGKVVRARQFMHGKTSAVKHKGKGLFKGVPQNFLAARYHSLIVERRSLPAALEVTAETADGIIMGLQHRKHNVHGVQFHPESIMTDAGKTILTNFLGGLRGRK